MSTTIAQGAPSGPFGVSRRPHHDQENAETKQTSQPRKARGSCGARWHAACANGAGEGEPATEQRPAMEQAIAGDLLGGFFCSEFAHDASRLIAAS
jgi:hypothetical protein